MAAASSPKLHPKSMFGRSPCPIRWHITKEAPGSLKAQMLKLSEAGQRNTDIATSSSSSTAKTSCVDIRRCPEDIPNVRQIPELGDERSIP